MKYWVPIQGYEDHYWINKNGQVKSRRKILKSYINKNRYETVMLSKNNIQKMKYVHRLLATAFIPNPESLPEVNHIDGIRSNNKIENLEWVTRQGNAIHAVRTGLAPKGEQQYSAKFSNKQAEEIRQRVAKGEKQIKIAREYDVDPRLVNLIVLRRTYV